MTRFLRLLAALVAALVVVGSGVALASPAAAQDNTAVAVNTKDGSSVFKFAFDIKKVASNIVDNGNAAVAYASCTDCDTVAVAIQVVLVSGDPDVVAPQNVAIAFNEDCNLCTTLAMAYQYVFNVGDEPVHFTAEGKARLKEIKKQFKDLKNADLTAEEMLVLVDALAQQVNDVVVNELKAGPPGQADDTASSSTTTAPADGALPTTTAPASSTTTEPPAPTTTSTITSTSTTPTTTTP